MKIFNETHFLGTSSFLLLVAMLLRFKFERLQLLAPISFRYLHQTLQRTPYDGRESLQASPPLRTLLATLILECPARKKT